MKLEQILEKIKTNVDKKKIGMGAVALTACAMVGYVAIDKEKPTITTEKVQVAYGEELDVSQIDITDNRDAREDLIVDVNLKSFNNKQLGEYEVEVTATDKASNEAKKTIKVEVIDNKGPEFEVAGASEGYLVEVPVYGSTDVLSYIKATDNVDGDVTQFVEVTGELKTETLGEKSEISLKVNDNAGNTTEQKFTFVVADLEAPKIELTQGENAVIDYGSEFALDKVANITDNYDQEVTISTEGEIDTKKEDGTQKFKIKAVDTSGNESEAEVTIEIKDTSGPEITLSTESVTLTKDGAFVPLDYLTSAIDNKDEDVTANVTSEGANTSEVGTKEVVYTVTDAAGNTSTATLTLTVNEPAKEKVASGGAGGSQGSNDTVTSNGTGNQAIANAALGQIGVYQDCTMLVTNSLKAVGINFHGWPAEYLNLGKTVSYAEALPGDIIYYADGGTGLAHVAIYVGDGMAVHGGFYGNQTVKYSVFVGSSPVFIRVG